MHRLFAVPLAALSIMETPAAAVQLVTGGFETGDFTGWTLAGDLAFQSVIAAPIAGGPLEGDFHAALGAPRATAFLQQAVDVRAGLPYTVTLGYAYRGGTDNRLIVQIDGIDRLSFQAADDLDYQRWSFAGVAGAGGLRLAVGVRSATGFWLLDDIRVAAPIPEPATWALLLSGFLGVGIALRRRPIPTVAPATAPGPPSANRSPEPQNRRQQDRRRKQRPSRCRSQSRLQAPSPADGQPIRATPDMASTARIESRLRIRPMRIIWRMDTRPVA